MATEFIKIKFDTDERDVVHVTLDYEMDEVDPEIMIEALYDLARDEERSYQLFCVKKEMEEDLQNRRN